MESHRSIKFFIVGASGLIGRYLYNRLVKSGKAIGTCFPAPGREYINLDIRDKKQVNGLLEKYSPETIIHSAAVANTDYCEEHPLESGEVNIEGTRNLIDYAQRHNVKFVYFSSDYIFDGKAGPYSEEDKPNPLNEYGRQKAEIEHIIAGNLKNYLIIRTTVVYGWEKARKNFVTRVIDNLKNGRNIKVPIDQIGSPTYGSNLSDAVGELLMGNKTGIYNIAGPALINRYDFARLICKTFSLNENLLAPAVSKNLCPKAARPLNAGLKIEKAKQELKTELLGPEDGLLAMSLEKNQYGRY